MHYIIKIHSEKPSLALVPVLVNTTSITVVYKDKCQFINTKDNMYIRWKCYNKINSSEFYKFSVLVYQKQSASYRPNHTFHIMDTESNC